MYSLPHMYIHTFHKSIGVSQRQQDVKQVINSQIYKFTLQNTTNILQKQYYKSSFKIKNSSMGKRVCM